MATTQKKPLTLSEILKGKFKDSDLKGVSPLVTQQLKIAADSLVSQSDTKSQKAGKNILNFVNKASQNQVPQYKITPSVPIPQTGYKPPTPSFIPSQQPKYPNTQIGTYKGGTSLPEPSPFVSKLKSSPLLSPFFKNGAPLGTEAGNDALKQAMGEGFKTIYQAPGGVLGGVKKIFKPSDPGYGGSEKAVPLSGPTQLVSPESVKKAGIIKRFVGGFVGNVPSLGGTDQLVEDKDLDETIKFIAPVMFSYGRALASPFLKKTGSKVLEATERAVLYKNKKVEGEDIKKAFQQLTSGNPQGAKQEAIEVAQNLINLNKKGSEIFKAINEGATIKVKRDFLGWAKDLFSMKASKTPEIQAFLTEARKAVTENQINQVYQRGLSLFKESRLAGLKGLESGKARLGIEKMAPLVQPRQVGGEMSGIEPLIQEAKKYKSAEEFVKAQKTAYHGGNIEDIADFNLKFKVGDSRNDPLSNMGINLGDKNTAQFFADRKGGKVVEVYVDPKKVKKTTYNNLLHEVADMMEEKSGISYGQQIRRLKTTESKNEFLIDNLSDPQIAKEIAEKYKEQGYDLITYKNTLDGGESYIPLTKDVLKTKSQLTDIWNQANSKLPSTELKTNKLAFLGGDKKLTPAELARREVETPVDNKIITAIERAVGKKQSQEFKIKFKSNKAFNQIEKAGLSSEAEFNELFNYFDNPAKYPLPSEIQRKLGTDGINRLKELKSLLTTEQTERGLLTSVIDDDNYMRTFIVQADGKPATPSQMNSLLEGTSSGLLKRLFGISKTEGVSGLSIKNRYNQSRKFENADSRDAYLKQFGLKTDRNFVEVMRKTVNQVSKITSNYDFIKSLRDQAKRGISGVKEVYDPVVFKTFREQQYQTLKSIREKILERARADKLISNNDYMEAKASTADIIDDLKVVLREDANTPSDLRKIYLDQANVDFKVAKTALFEDMKTNASKISELAKADIDRAKAMTEKNISDEINKISQNYADALEAGYSRPKDLIIAQQMTGLVFDKPSLKALDKIFEKLKPSNLEDLIRGIKLFIATGDLFQLPEVARQRFATAGAKGLLQNWGFDESTFYSKGIDAVEHGLLLGKPSDIAIELTKKLGRELDDVEKSFLAKSASKVQDIVGKTPVLGFVSEKTGKLFESLERLQWETVLPNAKLSVYDKLWPKILKTKKGLSVEEAKKLTAEFVNDTFQGINWERLMAGNSAMGKIMNQRRLRAMRYTFFGPDRIASIFNRYTKGFGKMGGQYRKFWIRSLIAGLVIQQSLNYAFNGHSTLENKKGNEFELQIPQIKDEKGNPMSVNILGTWIEPLKFINKPGNYIMNKLGILPKILGIGQESYYRPETFTDFIWENKPLPFSIQQLLSTQRQSPKKRTGETTFPIAASRAGLEFTGFPTTFRSGANKAATIKDLMQGKATFWQYALSKDVTGKPQPSIFKNLFGGKNKKKSNKYL